MRGATVFTSMFTEQGAISIHAPHAGCDAYLTSDERDTLISIHAPHAGCDNKLNRRI